VQPFQAFSGTGARQTLPGAAERAVTAAEKSCPQLRPKPEESAEKRPS